MMTINCSFQHLSPCEHLVWGALLQISRNILLQLSRVNILVVLSHGCVGNPLWTGVSYGALFAVTERSEGVLWGVTSYGDPVLFLLQLLGQVSELLIGQRQTLNWP